MTAIPNISMNDVVIDNLSKEEQNRFHVLYELGWADLHVEEEDRDTSIYVAEQGFEAGDGNEYKYLVLGSCDDEEENQIRYAQFTNNQEVYAHWERVLKDQGI